MNTNRSFIFTALATTLICSAAVPSVKAAPPVQPGRPQSIASLDETPRGLTKLDWQGIRVAFEAGLHSFQSAEGGEGHWHARNPGQQWLTTFDQRGFETIPQSGGWTWGLELQSYGFGDDQTVISGIPGVQAAGQQLTYQWDATVEEWFVNDQRGLKHGFTIARRPAQACRRPEASASPCLSFTLSTRGPLRPNVTADGQAVLYQDASGVTVLNYTGLKVWDADGKVLASHFASAETGVRLLVEERGARYPLTIDPIAQQAYLKPGNSGPGDNFGISVAVSGNTAVIGAYGESSNATTVGGDGTNNNASRSGAAYVFTRSAGVWSQQAYLKASNSGAGDYFGYSVAVSGDTAVIGAYMEDSNATTVGGDGSNNSSANSGAAYIFTRSGSTWTQQAYLKAGNSGANDWFGASVAVSGDTAVIGAWQEDSNATTVGGNGANNSAANSGAAYVFTRSAGVWIQQAYLKASNSGAGDYFGISVAVSGDTAVIGAHLESSNATTVGGDGSDNSAANSGAAYVFTRSAGVWSQQAYLKASNSGAGDYFGASVAVSGNTAVIGAYGESSNATTVGGDGTNNNAANSGAAYVFTRNAGVWSQQAYLKAGNSGANDTFGLSVAVSGDTAIIGASNEDSNATTVGGDGSNNSSTHSGAAYAFTRSGTLWTQQAYLKAGNAEAGDRFGISVAVSDGTAIVGAFLEASNATTVGGDGTNNSFPDSGAAYVFSGFGSAAPTPTVTASTANLDLTATTLTIAGTGFDALIPENNSVAFTPSGTGTVTASTATSLTVTGLGGLTPGALNALVTANGQNSGVAVQVATVLSALQSWRQTNFGSTANSGNAADGADPDGDGVVNLLEYAAGQNPTTTDTLTTSASSNGGEIGFNYPRSIAARSAGTVFSVEWSDELQGTTPWNTTGVREEVISTGNAVEQVKATLPAGGAGRRFVRLRVTSPP